MVNLPITILLIVHKFFMFINKKFKVTVFNYCAQWSGVDDQAMSHTK